MLTMFIVGVGMLAFGTKRALGLSESFQHPSELGGAGASTGDKMAGEHQRNLVDEPIIVDKVGELIDAIDKPHFMF